ncbi:unnamed protein product, partial [Ectocarpus sp. 12 AP-2014]
LRAHQGEKVSGANEPVTLNATEDAMALVWGVTEEVLRLADMNSGASAGAGGGLDGTGSGGGYASGSGSSSDEDGDADDGSEDEWYDAFGSEFESGFQEQPKPRRRRGVLRTAFATAAGRRRSSSKKKKKQTQKQKEAGSSSGRPPFLRRRKASDDSAAAGRSGIGFASRGRGLSCSSSFSQGGAAGEDGSGSGGGLWAATSSSSVLSVTSAGGGDAHAPPACFPSPRSPTLKAAAVVDAVALGGVRHRGAAALRCRGSRSSDKPSSTLSGLTVHLPVDHNNPFGRSLRVAVGGLTVRDLVSAAVAYPASSSPRKLGVDAAVGTVSAAWARGIPQAAAASAAAAAEAQAGAGGVRPAAA